MATEMIYHLVVEKENVLSRSSTAFLSNKKLNSQPVYRMSDAKKHLAVSREWREESSGPAAVWRKASGRLDPGGSVDLLFQGSTHFGNRICDSVWEKSLVISFYFCQEIASWDCQLWSQGIKNVQNTVLWRMLDIYRWLAPLIHMTQICLT